MSTLAGSSFFVNEFQKQISEDNYQYGNESIDGTFERVSTYALGDDPNGDPAALKGAMLGRRISFGGRIVANAGTSYKGVSNFNCYGAQRSVKPVDSISCIYSDLANAAHILKTEGGIGFNFNHLRPAGTLIKGIGSATPGVVKFMELYDKSSEIITGGFVGEWMQADGFDTKKRVRKGAMMAMLDIRHPDIIDFITAKSVPNRLERFNMSVIITDEFMDATLNDDEWNLWFPDIHCEVYDAEWNGDFDVWKEKGYPVIVYKTMKAKDILNLILTNTYNRNEPGVYFIDAANRYNNLAVIGQKITGTNPCGEIGMIGDGGSAVIFDPTEDLAIRGGLVRVDYFGDICNLVNINLTMYVALNSSGQPQFDFEKFEEDIYLAVRSADNMLDKSAYPLEALKNAAMLRRKIGLGVMGYGSMLMMMGLRYGSDDACEFTERILWTKANAEYSASAILAKEKGPFPLWDPKMMDSGFIKHSGKLSDETLALIREHGLRNSQLSTCAPTGTTGIFMGIVTGGMEPAIDLEYYRWITWSHRASDVGLELPDLRNLANLAPTADFKWVKKGGEEFLESNDGDYRVDRSRGLVKRIVCEDYGWRWVRENYTLETIAKMKRKGVFAKSTELSVAEHARVFALFSEFVDNSISKTINIKADYPFAEFEDLFIRMWEEGCRGCTTYRDGTMAGVLETKDGPTAKTVKQQQKDFIEAFEGHDADVVFDEVKLPGEYPAKGYVISSEGKKWYLHVAFKDRKMTKPFALFVNTNAKEPNVLTYDALDQLEKLAAASGLVNGRLAEVKEKIAGQPNVVKLSRFVGFLLRHNVKVIDIVMALDNVKDAFVSSFVVRMKKFLMQFVQEEEVKGVRCPECKEPMNMVESCMICTHCGLSKCG